MVKFVPVVAYGLLATPAFAQTTHADKSQYTLVNPTPREQWRPMSADRPDFTESPYTVDAGAIQIELSFVNYAQDSGDQAWSFAPVNLKIGLLNDVDLQLVLNPYTHAQSEDEDHDGFGDLQFRLKINLWGNDGGSTAFAVMPFIKLPTASDALGNDRVEGGLIFPFATETTERIGLGLMFETDFVYDDEDDGYDLDLIATGVLGFDLTDDHGLYLEGIGISSTDSGTDFRGILGVGTTYSITDDLVLDAGVNLGLTGEVNDVNLFAGMTVRF